MTHDHPDHLDPEIVAAWVDGSLDSQARAEAEAHAADCGRCQAVLAAMIRTEPVLAPKPAWLGGPLRWLVPLATATAVAGIWILVSPGAPPAPRLESVPVAEAPQSAAARQAPVDALAPAPASELQKRKEPAPPPAGRDRAAARNETKKDFRKAAQPPAAVVAETVTLADQRAPQGRLSQQQVQGQAGVAVQSPPLQTQVTAATPPPPSPAPASASPPPPPPPPATTTSRMDAVRQQEVRAKDALMSRAMATFGEVASPDQTTRWRYGPGDAIHRSTDGGKTWVLQATGVAGQSFGARVMMTELLAASATSSTVCWIVGRGGVVLLSTDGATWRRLPFAETIDLSAVTATDARTASVAAVDGRVFRTTDGGVTWVR